MNGQWTGTYTGTNKGVLLVELDDRGDHYDGTVYAIEQGTPGAPPVHGRLLNVPKGEKSLKLTVPLTVIDALYGREIPKETLAKHFPGTTWSDRADSEWEVGSDCIKIKWTTPAGTHGDGEVTRPAPSNSKLVPDPNIRTWSDFKAYAVKLEPERFFFRGQENNEWQICTSFHRTGRAVLRRFSETDVPSLHRNLSGLTTHRFILADEQDYAAFLHLVQHHGYPTPLLDWTYSPFIAAYFAFRNIRRETSSGKVRVLVFDGRGWQNAFASARVMSPAYLHLTILEPLAINNPRVVPQQSISTVTNVEHLEAYISRREEESRMRFLTAIDLPAGEYRTVLRELGLMGINAGTLFPGLDGACQQLRERFFDF